MKEADYRDFVHKLDGLKTRRPLYGQIEFTYRCSHNCIHCYCNNQPKDELGSAFWKGIFDQVCDLGGTEITLTGGDPLLYEGFEEVYLYAKKKGFLINLFTSGFALSKGLLDLLESSPPFNIEITINSLNKENYEKITRTKGAFDEVMRNIYEVKKRDLPLTLKCNGLKENKEEILKIKEFTEKLLGRKRFKFDSFIFPALDAAQEPTRHRLKPQEIIKIEKQDRDMIEQRKKQLRHSLKHQPGFFNPDGLYHCNSWFTKYFINPQGILQFCHLTKEYSTDLRKEPFKKGFDKFPELLKEKYKNDSKCISCEYKEFCYHCPARAYLECGDEEAPVEYYCQLAKATRDYQASLEKDKCRLRL